MRTKNTYKIPKPIVDFSNIDTSFADRMKHFDDKINGKLNIVKIEKIQKNSNKKSLSKKNTISLSKRKLSSKKVKTI